jgi:tetratricopeptide (TPR) repeat protein
MLDVQLFGIDPEAHHVINLVIHIANTLLLFWLLVQLTEAPGRSAAIAAFFAVHPLHVESVAWVAERKDVLSTFFSILTLGCYVAYVRKHGRLRYYGTLALFAAGLMAKPMLVTLPFVLLLLDFWPLQRWTLKNRIPLPALVREKVPFVALALVSSVVTFLVQRSGRAVIGLDRVPIGNRVANAFLSYFTYIERMVWPHDLSVLYPVTPTVPGWWVAAAFGVLGISAAAIWVAERKPYIPVGWFWYVGTLIPVIGLVQVGKQASADRYTYVPLIGLFLIVVFGAYDIFQYRWPPGKSLMLASGGIAILLCVWLTREQLQYWRSSQTLWEHALSLNNENASAHVNVGSDLEKRGKLDEGIAHYREALRIEPEMAVAHSNLASALEKQGQLDEAIKHYAEALRIGPEAAEWDFNLGNALVKTGRPERLADAMQYLSQAFHRRPDFPEAHNALGICYLTRGEMDKAVAEFSEAIKLKPDYASAHNNLATVFGNLGRLDDAVSEFSQAVRLDPSYTDAHENLGILLARQGKSNDAIEHFAAVLRINPGDDLAKEWLTRLARNKVASARE